LYIPTEPSKILRNLIQQQDIGSTRLEFLETCGRYRVSVFNYSPKEVEEELKRDLKEASKLAGE
jgi:hypothetical protein